MVGRPLAHPDSWRLAQLALSVPVVAFGLALLSGEPGGLLVIAAGIGLLAILVIERLLSPPMTVRLHKT